jgi:isoleucyl-tRNA synthetase
MAALLGIRSRVNAEIEPLRAAGKLGKSLDAAIALKIPAGDPVGAVVERYRDSLAELFIVSRVSIETGAAQPGTAGAGPLGIEVRHCQDLGHVRCPRCWRWVPDLGHSAHGNVCPRCAEALP